MSDLLNVRTAQEADEDGIMALCRLLHDENGLFGLDEERVRRVLRRAWARDNVIIGVIGPVGAPVACVTLFITECWYSGEPDIEELFAFVHPDHRAGARHAEDLIRFAKHCSDLLEIPLTMGVISNKRTAAKIRFYRRMLEPAGEFFVYNRRFLKKDASPEVAEAAE